MYLGPKAKINYLVSYIKLLLVNMNYLDFFFFCLKKFINAKKFDKTFYIFWCDRLIVVSKRVMSMVNLVEN